MHDWASWLAYGRDAGDAATALETQLALLAVRDRLLDSALAVPGVTVLDVGAGEGLVGLGALERVGPDGMVYFVDTSPSLLDHCRASAERLGVSERCVFLEADAESLVGVSDASVDVVTTRAVLAHLRDKRAALGSFLRVLRPGGRVASFEPIRRFGLGLSADGSSFWGYDTTAVAAEARKVTALFAEAESPERDPSVAFGPDDLFDIAVDAGFESVRADVTTQHSRRVPQRWDVFSRRTTVPWAPSLQGAIEQALTPAESSLFVAHLRPLVEQGRGSWRACAVFLTAVKAGGWR